MKNEKSKNILVVNEIEIFIKNVFLLHFPHFEYIVLTKK